MRKVIKLTKIDSIEGQPQNYPIGKEKIGKYHTDPVVGRTFVLSNASHTSIVTEIIDEHTFKTKNSIYKWEYITP